MFGYSILYVLVVKFNVLHGLIKTIELVVSHKYGCLIERCFMPCSERDEFEKSLGDLQKQHAYLETTHQAIVRERDELAAEVSVPLCGSSSQTSVGILHEMSNFSGLLFSLFSLLRVKKAARSLIH
jgi:hypothetical protein